ncbi:MAG TPA: TAXI family TRAP transporter solute-binding subunit [Rhodospirillaceae bacterium]|nr:TAXI family TRAP transporter solute-binding subunit [Rhodospirillaceae bacterium]
MMKKALALILLLTGGLAVAAASAPARNLILGSGEVAGMFFPEAGAICRVVNRDQLRHGLRCLVEPSGGSAANLAALQSGAQQLAIVQSRVLAQAVAGTGPFARTPMTNLRTLMSLHGEAVVVVVGPSSKIRSLADLKGKRVNLGHAGGFQRTMADLLLGAVGMGAADLGAALEIEPARVIQGLCRNELDAAVFAGLHPIAEVQEAIDECGAGLLSLKDPGLDGFLKGNQAFVRLAVNADSYPGLAGKVAGLGLRAVLVAADSLAAEVPIRWSRR